MITLDEKKVEEIKRSRFPTLSPAEFELKLLKAGLRQQILDYVATSEELQIVFNRATYFSRTDPFLLKKSSTLHLINPKSIYLCIAKI